MSWLAGLTVRTKLIGSFLIVALIAAIIGMVGVSATGQVNTMAAGMHDIELAGLDYASRANSMLVAAGRSMRSALLVQTVDEREVELNKISDRMAAVKVNLDKLDDLFVTVAGKEMVARAHAAVKEYEAGLSRVLAELKLEAPGQADKSIVVLMQDARPLGNAAEAVVAELLAIKRANAGRFAAESADVYTNTVIVMNVLTAVGVLMALLLGWGLTRNLTRQLGGEPAQVAAIANAIAEGDLTRRIDTSHAVQGSVMLAMSTMQQSLRK